MPESDVCSKSAESAYLTKPNIVLPTTSAAAATAATTVGKQGLADEYGLTSVTAPLAVDADLTPQVP
jgi:hypothetical protein